MSLKKNKALLFDMDGTLFDTTMVNFNAYKAALNQYGYALDFDFYMKEFHGNAYSHFLPLVIGENNEHLKAIHTFKKTIYPTFLHHARMNVFLFDTIEALKSTYHIGMVTSASRQNVEDVLGHFDAQQHFELILTQEDVKHPKPSPEGYLKAMECFDVTSENTMIYEDSLVGFNAAKATGSIVLMISGF